MTFGFKEFVLVCVGTAAISYGLYDEINWLWVLCAGVLFSIVRIIHRVWVYRSFRKKINNLSSGSDTTKDDDFLSGVVSTSIILSRDSRDGGDGGGSDGGYD